MTIYIVMLCDDYGGVDLERAFSNLGDAKEYASSWDDSKSIYTQIRETVLED